MDYLFYVLGVNKLTNVTFLETFANVISEWSHIAYFFLILAYYRYYLLLRK